MIYTRVFEKNITLSDVHEIFSTDPDALLLKKIQDSFENKCYKSCYIISVNKILNRSDINFNNKDLNGSANVSVKFETSILQYEKFDIVTNVTITAITDRIIACQSHDSLIFIQNEERLKDYKDGQIIPIKIGICNYGLGNNKISINAFPFVPINEEFENEYYYKINKLSNEDIESLNGLDIIKNIEDAEHMMESIKKEKNNRWEYFDDLLYPFKTVKKINKNIKEIGLCDFKLLKDNGSNIVSMLPYQYISSKKIALIDPDSSKVNKKKFGDENYPIDENPLLIYEMYLTKYYKHINSVNQLSLSYKDDELFKNSANIFNIYKMNKL